MPELAVPHQTAAKPPGSQRLMSIDALRGFDMFWIIGADALVGALNHIVESNPPDGNAGPIKSAICGAIRWLMEIIDTQLEHVTWQGVHFYDLIFPLFVFIMGVSAVFSLTKQIQQDGRLAALKRLLRRSIVLFIIALIYSGGVSSPWPDIRVMGVLNRIAICYFFGGLIFIFCKPRVMVAIAVALLLGYWAIMAEIPIRDIRMAHYKESGVVLVDNDVDKIMKDTSTTNAAQVFYGTTNWVKGKYEMGYNVANHFDFMYLGGRKYDTYWDPEGLLSNLPAIVTGLLGIFAGLLLKNGRVADMKKVSYLLAFGAGSVVLGCIWGTQFPIVKKIWSSSYVLVAGGYGAIMLGVFYWMVDIKKWRVWCQPFVWMGMNSITVYMASNLLGGGGFLKIATRLVGGDVRMFFDNHVAKGAGGLIVCIVGLGLAFWFVNFLYRKKIFLRV